MSTTLETPISSIESNRRRVGALKSLGVVSVGDALTYYPFRVTDPVPARSLHEAKIGEKMAFAAHVLETRVFPMARRGFRLIATVTDDDFAARRNTPKSLASLVFFSYRKSYVDWVQRKLHAGALLVVAGEPSVYDNRLQFTHPDLLTINPVQSQSENGEWNDGFGDPANPPLGNLKYDAQTIDEALKRVCRPRPVYHATSRISSEHIHESVLKYMDALRGAEYLATQNAGNFLDNPTQEGDFDIPQIDREIQIKVLGNAIPDIIPEDFREEYGLMHRAEAFMAIHDPVDRKNFDNALQTLRYEEALICQTALVKSRDASRKSKATACPETRLKDDFIASLPFALTNGQQQVIADISADMAHDYPMQRLLQGEVGSGKTVVAVAAMMQAVGSGGQAVLVAPTQVLAGQHYASISTMVSKLGKSDANSSDNQKNLDDANARRSNKRSAQSSKDGEFDAKTIHNNAVDKGVQLADLLDLAASDDVETGFSGKGNDIFGTKDGEIPVFLLTGSMRLAERRRVLAAAASGMPCIVVATHAAFSKSFQAPNLTLAVIDEQHRFGVRQRGLLAEKAANPHLLVMSATPIPRTLGLLIYGDLDISVLDELPPGRTPVKTRCITGKRRQDLYRFLDSEIDKGRQVYLVCPAIEDVPDGGLNAVKTYYEDIAKALLPDRRVGLMHGKLKPKEKAEVMDDFKSGRLDALVSTTVIEVGVDVPNATVMVIENAERYGLSALHQLRGRVGRGAAESWCFLVSDNASESVQKRLKFLCSTSDGFAVAQYDLETRGPGDFFGSRQHGLPTLQIADLMNDTRTLHAAQSEAVALLAEDPLLERPEHALLARQVEQMFDKAGAMN